MPDAVTFDVPETALQRRDGARPGPLPGVLRPALRPTGARSHEPRAGRPYRGDRWGRAPYRRRPFVPGLRGRLRAIGHLGRARGSRGRRVRVAPVHLRFAMGTRAPRPRGVALGRDRHRVGREHPLGVQPGAREAGGSAHTGASGGTERPDVVFLVDLAVGRVEVTVLPVYVQGRYRKLDRTLPQTRWPCRRCQGRGCDTCGGTGKTYAESVEEIVAAPFLRATGGEGSRFHGMGREDIDARMLGRGRPFVLELLRPAPAHARPRADRRGARRERTRTGRGRSTSPPRRPPTSSE